MGSKMVQELQQYSIPTGEQPTVLCVQFSITQ